MIILHITFKYNTSVVSIIKMVFFAASNNQSLTLNSHFGYAIHQRAHNVSNKIRERHLYGQISLQLYTWLSHIKSYFSFSYLLKPSVEQRLKKQTPNNGYLDNFYTSNCACLFPLKNNYLLKKTVLSIELQENIERNSNLLKLNRKRHQHMFTQIRSFRTEKNVIKGNDKDSGLCKRMKIFFGLNDVPASNKSQVKRDLENFRNNMNQENLTPEQNQRLLLAFVEGYLLAKESLMHPIPTWRRYPLTIFIVVAGLLFIIFKKSNIFSMFKNSNLSLEISESDVKFSDVKGADEAKQELKNVVEFLKNPEKFSALGGKLPKGVLLVGPPGTGKTLLAKAVAGEAGVPFFSTSGPEFDEIYVGVGARRIRELFKLAKENIPCVIFIDEIDSIGKERTSSSLHPHANDTINQLLSEMDGFRNSGGIIVLGATNRKEDLDKALLRPGRFDVEVTVLVPDFTGRKELLEFYLNQIRHQNIDIERLARGTTNFTGADIENMVNQAALRAAVIGAQHVTMEHLEYARDKALMGPESMSRIADEETNKITAYHEGGHTVVAYFTEHSQPLHKVTIIARGSSLGHTAYIPDKDIYHITKTQLLAMLDAMMGGRAAEELVFGSEKITSGASSDLEKATEIASKMVKRWGMSDVVGLPTYGSHSLISPQTANLIDMEIKKILQESYERAKNVLITHREKHKELSEALLKYETLDAEEIAAIMNGHKDFINRRNK